MFPCDVYALGPVLAKNKADARKQARVWEGCKRLPNGFKVWEE